MRDKALALTRAQLLEIKARGALASVAQAIGISGRGTQDELLKRIIQQQAKRRYYDRHTRKEYA